MSLNYKGEVPVVDCSGDRGFTVQSGREEADINKIIARYEKGGQLPPVLAKEPFYGDVSSLSGLADAFMKVQAAQELFMGFPAKVRERFDNDAVKLVEFFEDSDNLKEAVELGFIDKKPEKKPEVVAVLAPVLTPPAPLAAPSPIATGK